MFTTFNHRSDVNDAKYFNLQGDLDIADVQYLEPQVDLSFGSGRNFEF